jgi:hypothetical protein
MVVMVQAQSHIVINTKTIMFKDFPWCTKIHTDYIKSKLKYKSKSHNMIIKNKTMKYINGILFKKVELLVQHQSN